MEVRESIGRAARNASSSLVLALVALLAVLPLCIRGPSCGHDFDFHLLSWLETSTQFAHGGYPAWAYTPAWNAGEPRFLFYPPLSWTLGGVLGLLGPGALGAFIHHKDALWSAVPIVFTALCLLLSGMAAHRVLRRHASPDAALLVAALYAVNPYMLFTAYERTAYGELLAAAAMPLLLDAALRTRGSWAKRILRVTAPVALLWLSNAPAAVMGCYALALMTVTRLLLPDPRGGAHSAAVPWREGSRASPRLYLIVTTVAGTALGLLLPAFYLLPAAWEQRSITSSLAVIASMQPADNTLFHHMLPATEDTLLHDAVLHTASVLALALLVCIALAAVLIYAKHRPLGRIMPALVLSAGVAFLLTPASLPVWRHMPELMFLQFPWRLCALLTPVLALLLATLLSSPGAETRNEPLKRTLLFAPVCALLLIVPAGRAFYQPCDGEDAVPARVALFHSRAGTEPTDEYTPIDADPDQLRPHNPGYWLIPKTTRGVGVNSPAPADAAAGPAPDRLSLQLAGPAILVLNRRAYPAWHVLRNGVMVSPERLPARDDGLLAVELPAGSSRLELVFVRTADRWIGLACSLIALALCALLAVRVSREQRRSPVDTHPVHSDATT